MLAHDVFDRRWSLDWYCKDTDQNISARSLTLLIFAVGWALCVKYFNRLKLYLLSGNIFRKWFASYFLFVHEHLIIMWSPTVNLIAVTTLLLTSGLHRCQQRIFKENTNYFYAVRISIILAILSEIFIHICYYFWELCKKTKVGVLSEHSVFVFLSRVSILTHDIDIANLSVCLSVTFRYQMKTA